MKAIHLNMAYISVHYFHLFENMFFIKSIIFLYNFDLFLERSNIFSIAIFILKKI